MTFLPKEVAEGGTMRQGFLAFLHTPKVYRIQSLSKKGADDDILSPINTKHIVTGSGQVERIGSKPSLFSAAKHLLTDV
jgi:hypothetical protein